MAEQVTVGCKLAHGLVIGINGVHARLNGANDSKIIGGYGLTQVDKELADAWFEAYKEFDPIKAGLIFVQSKEDNAKAEASERKGTKSGAEKLNPKAPAPGIEAKKDD